MVLESKICRTCKVLKSLESFSKESRRNKSDGLATKCKECTARYEADRVSSNKAKFKGLVENICGVCGIIKPVSDFHKNAGKDKGIEAACKDCRNTRIVEARYGLYKGELQELKDNASNKCEICKNNYPLAVDHCHSSGIIRGMLCTNCNNGLGRFKDSVENLQNAINYLMERT